ncbi:urea amidolyase associated protein UAAP1 [Nitrosomonas sp.]|uniref:urea amidolyase associated protein UAAP1 n=1 Tax=Nitrosomonas sp. TaxID=42353 RepID=UPI0025FE78DD|nr:urea amidolyase associated protein UAAP1 [Nitrosomonas sp.]
MNQPIIIWKPTIPGGCHWSGIIRRGTTLRLIDVDGGANAAVLFFNQEEKLERYNMADTLKSQHTFHLTKGHACHSDMGRIFCCITADTCGWHDTVCGLSDTSLIQQKYGTARFQEHRNQMFRSGLDGLLIELGKWDLGMRDIVANINFFSKVTADTSGELAYQFDHSKAGDYVDLSFVMNTLVVLSTAPHPLDPKKPYQPGAVNLELFNTPPQVIKECLHISENIRALQNVQNFYCEGAK